KDVSQEIFAFALRSSRSVSDFETLICSILRGEDIAWPHGRDAEAASCFLASARFHGVLPLIDRRLDDQPAPAGWPDQIIDACRKNALFEAMTELARRAEITRVIEALCSAGMPPLVLKGGALAYTHYPSPALRPRSDTDLLIPSDARRNAEET